VSRRLALQAGAAGLLGLGGAELAGLWSASVCSATPARSVIFISLSGGLSQIDSFDPKPDAPDGIRGEFQPIATRTPGLLISEALPRLAQRSHLWTVVRSLTHGSNDHSAGHALMLSGRSSLAPGFDLIRPGPNDDPAIAAVAGDLTRPRNNLPPAIVLPERLIHNTGRVIPGQFSGRMGARRDPWFLDISRFEPAAYGVYPEFEFAFDHQERAYTPGRKAFELASLVVPEGFSVGDNVEGIT
jgi:hypothetical protein